MKPLTQETPNPKSLRPAPHTWLGRLWNTWGFDTPEQRRVSNQALDAELHEARLRRLAQNGGLDPDNPDDYMTIQIRRHHQEEQAKLRAKTIRQLARDILAAQVPSHSRHELHSPRDVSDAIAQATQIYDLTYAARVEPVRTASQS
uniref:Uncharacterized protein n=1 Tax=Pseudomonas phage Nican01 TaxID=3138540 RepID=A0AAU6W0H0_9CAUD